jgi:hypothetical protein
MKKSIYLLCLALCIVFIIIGWLAHLFRGSFDAKMYFLAFVCFLIYTGIAIYQLKEDKLKNTFSKVLWVIILIVFNIVGGFLFYWVELKKRPVK